MISIQPGFALSGNRGTSTLFHPATGLEGDRGNIRYGLVQRRAIRFQTAK
jgi:hypothetical protein